MDIVSLRDLIDTPREVHCPSGGFVSYRYLLEKDGMGFSLHRTEIPRGPAQHWHYKYHLEACLCISGIGEIHNLTTDEKHEITAGVCYVLNDHDNHTFTAKTDVVLVSVFNPPVTGDEIHDADGSYLLGGAE